MTKEKMISKYFSLGEAMKNNHRIVNTLDFNQLINVEFLAQNVLDKVREKFGKTICSSIFRNTVLNKKVGGSKTSHHRALNGYAAADIVRVENGTLKDVFNYIKDNLDYAELIWEFGDENNPNWIHVSYNRDNKKNVKETLISYKDDDITKYKAY